MAQLLHNISRRILIQMKNSLKKTSLLIIFLVSSTHYIYAQNLEKSDLFQTWYLDKYGDENDYYEVPKWEKEDYMILKDDMTFEIKTEGEIGKGTWMLNTNGTYLEIKYDSGELEKIYIIYATSRTLVLMFDIDEYREMEAHYVSCS